MKKFFYELAIDKKKGILYTPLKIILWLASLVYGLGVKFMSALYDSHILKRVKLSVPVVSVGNMTLGGVGKTPLVEYIAGYIKTLNLKPVILIRGYMDKNSQKNCPLSDEAEMLKNNLVDVPVLVGANRIQNAQKFLDQNKADVFILDDGFQHWCLDRDLDIVAIDSTNPFGNYQMIPRGILREPLQSLNRADIVFLTKTDLRRSGDKDCREEIKVRAKDKLIVESVHNPSELINLRTKEVGKLHSIQNEHVALLCSIADPHSFEELCKKEGAIPKKNFFYMDHYVYSKEDILKVDSQCAEDGVAALVTTQKDAVKLTSYLDLFSKTLTIYAISLSIQCTLNEDKFLERINHLLHR